MSNYEQMWADLGMDLERHNAALAPLPDMYQSIFLSQKNRPKAMSYFDWFASEAHGQRIKELVDHRAKGGKVFGYFCAYIPEEIVIAADGVAAGLCAGEEISISTADQILPRNTCPLIKSAFGFKLERSSPFFQSSDLIVGETTCDGKKKTWELLADYAPVHVMELPQRRDEKDKELWISELFAFKDKIEEVTGNKVTEEKLAEAISLLDARRAALKRLYDLRKADPVPISGVDALLAPQLYYDDDPSRLTTNINALCNELEIRVKEKVGVVPSGTPRILIAGCPMVLPYWKVHPIIENRGAVVVCEESCVGSRLLTGDTIVKGQGLEAQIAAIAERQLKTHCACFTPNHERIEDILNLCWEYHVDGVVHFSLAFCQPYIMEAVKVKKALEQRNIPMLELETDYGEGDIGQITTRIEAFLEMVRK